MKPSTIILLVLLTLYITAIFASNIILKQTFNKLDKRDSYWNYNKISVRSFRHLKVTGGNVSNIIYEPSTSSSVRALNYLEFYLKDRIKISYLKDTLFLEVSDHNTSLSLKDWIRSKVLIRLFSPELLSVQAANTNLALFKFKQKELSCRVTGKSQLEVESYVSDIDHISVTARDSTKIHFEMAPELNASRSMHLNTLDARVQGNSILDVGHFRIETARYVIEDTSAIVLSGKTLSFLQQR